MEMSQFRKFKDELNKAATDAQSKADEAKAALAAFDKWMSECPLADGSTVKKPVAKKTVKRASALARSQSLMLTPATEEVMDVLTKRFMSISEISTALKDRNISLENNTLHERLKKLVQKADGQVIVGTASNGHTGWKAR